MKAPSTYECHTIDCDEIVQKGDEVFLVNGELYCHACVPVLCRCSGERIHADRARRLGCDQSGGCPELRDAMEF